MSETDWTKGFPIPNSTRADLVSAGFPQNLVETIDGEAWLTWKVKREK